MTLANWLRLHFGYQGDEQGAQGELARQQAKVDAQAAADTSRKRRDLSQDYRQESELHLVNWLRKQHGYEGGQDGAAAAFAALAPAERGICAPAVLRRAEGRRPRVQRGRRPALRQLPARTPRHRGAVPESDAAGGPIRYEGSFTMYGGAGLRSSFGGNIQLLTPGGQQVLGVEGVAPPASAGVVTQGQGNIQLYAQGSVLLGQSRIMTTFGGHIQAWSANGDINAGRGAKTTVLYTPPRRSTTPSAT